MLNYQRVSIEFHGFSPSFVSTPPRANPHDLAVTALWPDAALSMHASAHPCPIGPGASVMWVKQ